ncbi:MAG: hypothetical protein QXL86_03135 [Candidatus Aenigmatarchaeota archaeon]
MKKLLYSEKEPDELFFSLSGGVTYFDGKSQLLKRKKEYPSLDEIFEEFRKKVKGLGFKEYIPENSYVQEIIPSEDPSVVYQIDRYWFKSKDVELSYEIKRKLHEKDGKPRCEEFKLEGTISTKNRRKANKVVKVLNSVFPNSIAKV